MQPRRSLGRRDGDHDTAEQQVASVDRELATTKVIVAQREIQFADRRLPRLVIGLGAELLSKRDVLRCGERVRDTTDQVGEHQQGDDDRKERSDHRR